MKQNIFCCGLIVVKFVTRPKLLEFSEQNVDGDKEKLTNMRSVFANPGWKNVCGFSNFGRFNAHTNLLSALAVIG